MLGAVPAGASLRIAIGLSVTAKARADAPVTGLVKAFLNPVGLNGLMTQTSWQITAVPASPGAVASQGVLPVSVPDKISGDVPQAALSDGPIKVVSQYASAAVQVLGWRLVITSLVLLIVVLIGLSLGMRRRRIRPVPLFPQPLPFDRQGPVRLVEPRKGRAQRSRGAAAMPDEAADSEAAAGTPGDPVDGGSADAAAAGSVGRRGRRTRGA